MSKENQFSSVGDEDYFTKAMEDFLSTEKMQKKYKHSEETIMNEEFERDYYEIQDDDYHEVMDDDYQEVIDDPENTERSNKELIEFLKKEREILTDDAKEDLTRRKK